MEALVDTAVLAADTPACVIAVERAEDLRQESRILGYVLVSLVAVVALALCVVVGFALDGKTTAAILTALGGLVDGAAAGFVVKRRTVANNMAAAAIREAKRICGTAVIAQLPGAPSSGSSD
jgi:hypothetical protein